VHYSEGVVRQQLTVALTERISYLVECDPTRLAHGPELGLVDFLEGQDLFRRVVALGKDVQGLSLELIPSRTREQLYQVLDDLVQGLKRIETFSPPDHASAPQLRDALLYDLEGYYESAFSLITPYLGYLHLKSAQIHETTRRAADDLQHSVRQVNTGLEELRKKLRELDHDLKERRKIELEAPRPAPGVYPAPATRGLSSEQLTHSWFWFLIFATGVIACLIWVGTVLYHWRDYRQSNPTSTGTY
jgi:hypothetical protein